MSANQLTKSIVRFLNYNGFQAWNVYNGAVYDRNKNIYRKNPTRKNGVFDICGFRESDGRHLEIEVKFGRDKMSAEQSRHLEELKKAGALCYVSKDLDGFFKWFESL